jgi:hypothetical protein
MAIRRKSKHSKERQLEFFNTSCGKNKSGKEVIFFWGYRNHVIFDALSELPVFEKTLPANVSDCMVMIPAFKELRRYFKFDTPKGVLADAAYDSVSIRKYIRRSLKAKDFIPVNPRAKKYNIRLTPGNIRICLAGLEMYPWGRFKEGNRIRRKFVCPITHLKSFAAK